MKKHYRVRNHKVTDHNYTLVDDIGAYIELLASHGSRTMFVWKEKGERKEITYGEEKGGGGSGSMGGISVMLLGVMAFLRIRKLKK